MQILALFRLSSADLTAFEAYEAQVLPLLASHGGVLTRRLRSEDGAIEAHLLSFPDQAAFDAYRADPARAAAQELWSRCGATSEVWSVVDVTSAPE